MTTSVEFLVEEPSCERLLHVVLPRIAPDMTYDIRTFNGKPDLLRKLPDRLRGYAPWIREAGVRLVVLLDRDSDDCRVLKRRLDDMARSAGLTVASDVARGEPFDVLNRIAIEELEAWLLGDVAALCAVYPRLSPSLGRRVAFRDPDDVRGGTAEALERELQRHGYHTAGLSKILNATEVAQHMAVDANTSASFRIFRDGVRRLVDMEVS
jgi:hypothetical protein